MAVLKFKDENGKFVDVPTITGKDGKDGIDGVDGKDGYTPVKGKDYWTEEDKNEIKSYIDEQLGVLENAYY